MSPFSVAARGMGVLDGVHVPQEEGRFGGQMGVAAREIGKVRPV